MFLYAIPILDDPQVYIGIVLFSIATILALLNLLKYRSKIASTEGMQPTGGADDNTLSDTKAIPMLRIFDKTKAIEFYVNWLGFKVDWEHSFSEGKPSKLEKKIAVLESLKVAHFREMTRSRHQLESLQNDRGTTEKTLGKLVADEAHYKGQLQYGNDGVKANPIQLTGLNSAESETIGKQIINLYKNWKPEAGGEQEEQIGNLYGFDLYIRRQREAYEENGMFEYRYSNSFYAQRTDEGIKYTYNNGLPNTDNPKLAARYFLNAIDRVEGLRERYTKTKDELDKEIPRLEQLVQKPFLKEQELQSMKSELSGLERQIAIKIQENQLRQHQQQDAEEEVATQDEAIEQVAPVIETETLNGHKAPKEILSQQAVEAQRVRSRMRL